MKRALLVLMLVASAAVVMAFQPPHLVRVLETRVAEGDWIAAGQLAGFYGGYGTLAPTTFASSEPVSLRIRREVQRSEESEAYWNSVALGLMVQAAEQGDHRAMLALGFGQSDRFGNSFLANGERQTGYLARTLVRQIESYDSAHPGPDLLDA